MKKIVLGLSFFLISISYASALSCLNLQNNLTQGWETSEVMSLQNYLSQKGFLTVEPNGYFGPSTLSAVRRYQDSVGLPDTGIVTSATRQAVYTETCTGQKFVPTQEQVSSPLSSLVPSPSCLDFKQDLIRGKENTNVLSLQKFLMKKGLLMVAPNSYFGPSTFTAVKSYQESLGLSRSGDVKSLTRSAIKNETCTNGVPSEISSVNQSNISDNMPSAYYPLGCISATGFSVITGASCSVHMIFNNGCTSFTGFSTTTGMSCSNSNATSSPVSLPVTFNNGCTSLNGFSITTGRSCSNSIATSSPVSIIASSTPIVPVTQVIRKLPSTPNERRQADTIVLLSAMYSFYLDSRGTFPMPMISATPIEICTLGISLCGNLNEVKSFLVPKFLTSIPMDPNLASSTGSGYFITRLGDGTVTITAPSADSGVTIYAKCNFSSGCSITTFASDSARQAGLPPHIDSIDNLIFLSGASTMSSLVIRGSSFSTSSSIVMLSLRGSSRKYILGAFPSIDQKTITATSGFTISPLSCGTSCFEVPPVGYYDVTVKTQIGDSNASAISLQGVTTSSISGSLARSLTPMSTHVKLGSVTLSSQTAVTLKSLAFSLSGTTTLLSKLSNFVLTDSVTKRTISGGLNFTIPDETINNNVTKLYDLYADIADVDTSYAGRIDITGAFTVNEAVSNTVFTAPIPKFMITVSY